LIQDWFKKGSTSVSVMVPMMSATTGRLVGGLTNTDLSISYHRDGESNGNFLMVQVGSLSGYVQNGWKESAEAAGLYNFGIHNIILASAPGVNAATLVFSATGCEDTVLRILLGDADLRDGEDLGLTAFVTLLGLAGHNRGLRECVYDGKNLLSATLCLYDSAAHAGVNDGQTGLLASYHLTNTYLDGRQATEKRVAV
jgi:hypothetical protein